MSCELADLTLEDEASFRHVGLYRELKRAMVDAKLRFLVARPESGVDRLDSVLLLNLAYWTPDAAAEVLVDDRLAADQLVHSAWHRLAHDALGSAARSADGLLFAEALASAFDVYLVGRLVGHAPESGFLETQVPAMRDAAEAAGLDEAGFERLLDRMVAEPESAFESLRQLLFDTTTALVAAPDLESAAVVLARAADHPMGALLHHYELPSWVLYARAYGSAVDPCDAVRALDRTLRSERDSLAWLERNWLS